MKTQPMPSMASASEPQKLVRDCIICESKRFTEVFDYTYDFLRDVRGNKEARLQFKWRWSPGVTSTIVRCNDCGCHYVRDVVLLSPEYHAVPAVYAIADDEVGGDAAAARKLAMYGHFDFQNSLIRNLVLMAVSRKGPQVKFLDFGAGFAEMGNMARVAGMTDVVAYDPYWPESIAHDLNKRNMPGIRYVRARDQLRQHGPFDVAVFQSAIEHVLDPRAELTSIFEVLAPGGHLYVNNPVMDLRRELPQLRSASKIEKRHRISHYHPGHVNYMMPKDFARLLREIGFEITPYAFYPPLPLVPGLIRQALVNHAKTALRTLQNVLNLPYPRHVYVVRKPTP